MSRPQITVEAVTTREGVAALAGEWEELLASAEESSPFLTLDWIVCCLDYDPARSPHVVVARSGSTVTGIAPLWRGQATYRGLQARTLSFIASSETPETDLIVRPDAREETLRAFVRYFYAGRPAAWDVVVLGQWPEDSTNAKLLRRLLEASRRPRFAGVSSIVPYIPIAGDWESFWQSRSYLFRKSRRGILNRLKRLGESEVVAIAGNRPDEALELYRSVAGRGWKHAEGLAVTSRPELGRFFECMTSTAGRRGWLRVWALKIGGEAVAVEYHIGSAGRMHALRADYDEAWAAHSPGACLEYHILRQLFEEGCREYSTGPGRDEYKRRWTDHERTNACVTLCRRTPAGLAVWVLEALAAPAVRRARALFRREPRAAS